MKENFKEMSMDSRSGSHLSVENIYISWWPCRKLPLIISNVNFNLAFNNIAEHGSYYQQYMGLIKFDQMSFSKQINNTSLSFLLHSIVCCINRFVTMLMNVLSMLYITSICQYSETTNLSFTITVLTVSLQT